MSIPQPNPVKGKQAVGTVLLSRLEQLGCQEAADLVRARMQFGLQKYGTELMTENGRDAIEDCMQEIGDLLMYYQQAVMEDKDLTQIKAMLNAVNKLMGQ
jgi:hypothetical protein